jgi:putative transposase
VWVRRRTTLVLLLVSASLVGSIPVNLRDTVTGIRTFITDRLITELHWAQVAKDLKPVYTAASEAAAIDAFAEFSGKWEKKYPAIIRLWENAWAEFIPFLQFDRDIRTVICTTNVIESINARLRRAVNARAGRPQVPVPRRHEPGSRRQVRKRWTNRWKAALNAFDITFDGRLSAGRS